MIYRYGAIGDTLTLTAFLASMRPVCDQVTLLGSAERLRLIDPALRDRVISFDLAVGDTRRLAAEHDLSVAFRSKRLPGFSHALPPLPPAGVSVYGWMKEQALMLGGEDKEPMIPLCSGRGTVIAPGSGSARKNAPIVQYLEIAAVCEQPVFVLGPAEGDQVEAAVRAAGWRVERPGDLSELDRLISTRAVFHGNDSGLMHLAAIRGLETHMYLVEPASRDWIPPGHVVVHEP